MKTNHYKPTNLFSMMISKRYFLVLVLALAGMTAKAQAVIMNGDYFLTHNEAGTSVNTAATTSFDPTTCLWAYVRRDYIRTANSNGTAIDNNNNYLQYTSLSLGTDWGDWYRGDNNENIYHRTGNNPNRRYHYPTLSGSTWGWAYNQDSQSSNTRLYNATITTQGPTDNTTAPTISIANLSGNTISFNHSDLGGTYVPQYTRYVFNNGTHNWYNGTDYGNTVPSVDANTLNPTYTWSVTTGGSYASINSSTGVLTITENPTGNITVRLTVSNISPISNKTVDFTLTRAAIAQSVNTATEITGPTLSPNSAALYFNDSQQFLSSASAASVTTTVPAHTTLTGGGNTYYYYDGTLYANTDGFSTSTEGTPVEVTLAWALSGDAALYLDSSRETNSTTVTHATQSPSDLTATLTVTATATGVSPKTATATITAYGPTVAPVITRTDNTISISTTTVGATIYYTTDGTTPSASNGTVYTAPFDLVTSPTTVKAIAIRGGHASTEASETFQIQLAAPVITISDTGLATIAPDEYGATIYYTTDGTTPTTSSSTYTAPVQLTNPQTIKAIAVKNGYTTSEVATADYITSGISGTKVVLDDREDHTWNYYNAAPDSDYPSNVLLSPEPRNVKITYRGGSVNNASAVAVSATESVNEFVYYKTIEKLAWGNSEGRWLTGNYAYKVIPNPFQKRPRTNGTTGTNGFYGFAGWRIVSGGEYINGHDNDEVLGLEEKINFVNLPAGNDGNGAVVFEATWTQATVVAVNGNVTGDNGLPNSGTYETNFIVVSGNDRTITGMTRNATVMGCYPDGTGATNARLSTVTGSANDLKIESVNLGTGGSDFTIRAGWLIVGRGCTGTVRRVIGDGNTGTSRRIRIESGTYNFICPMQGGNADNANYGLIIFGNDYDRATNDGLTSNDQYEDNSSHRKLRVINYVSFNGSGACKNSDVDLSEWMDITVKSGYYGFSADFSLFHSNPLNANGQDGLGLGIGGNVDAYVGPYSTFDIHNNPITYNVPNGNWNVVNENDYRWQRLMSFYCGRTRGGRYGGVNRVLVEGGELNSINGGGYKNGGENGDIGFHLRVRGGWIKGAAYGTASASATTANTKLVFTGGEVNGWIAGACNGTDVRIDNGTYYNGENLGKTYIYVGGNTEVRSHLRDEKYNNAWGLVGSLEGGNIFASGRGSFPEGTTNPELTYSGSSDETYAVVADNSLVEQNVVGGGYIGLAHNSHIYILGGVIGKNVYGGAMTPRSQSANWYAQNTDIRQYGGTVKGSIYGGHYQGENNAGKIQQNVNVTLYNGQVGTADEPGSVHGGGFGSGTGVGGNVDVRLGTCEATTGVTVFGDVYGGSALGSVNTNASNTTTVSLYKGIIYGGLYGGGLGDKASLGDGHSDVAALVNGAVSVNVYGGSVLCSATDPDGEAGTGSVFGCNNVNGAPQSTVTVDIYSTDQPASGYALHAVYGGGNKAPYTRVPVVTVHGCNNSIEYVYGGGNATDVLGTDVTIWGGTIGNAFGGGNGFSETGNHNDPTGEHYNPGANIIANGTNLKIYGGEIGAAFGGSNQFGTINSTINVTVDTKKEPGSDPCSGVAYEECDLVIDELYGGGNEAPIQTSGGVWIEPNVSLLTCDAYIKNFFGGAKAADYVGDIVTNITAGRFDNVFGGNNKGGTITGNVTLNLIGGTIGNAFGGCNESGNITGNITVNVIDGELECPLYITNVYGGGQDAAYTPNDPTIISPKVNISHKKQGTSVTGSVFGGGKGADAVVTANPYVTVGDNDNNHYSIVSGEVYGGGNAAAVVGSTEVLIKNRAKVIGNIYGGGNMGAVNGDTKVIINGRTN